MKCSVTGRVEVSSEVQRTIAFSQKTTAFSLHIRRLTVASQPKWLPELLRSKAATVRLHERLVAFCWADPFLPLPISFWFPQLIKGPPMGSSGFALTEMCARMLPTIFQKGTFPMPDIVEQKRRGRPTGSQDKVPRAPRPSAANGNGHSGPSRGAGRPAFPGGANPLTISTSSPACSLEGSNAPSFE